MSAPHNLALDELRLLNETLDEYEGLCGELCDRVLARHHGSILYVAPIGQTLSMTSAGGYEWTYHMVPVVDDLVHDAWHPDNVVSVDQYVRAVFPDARVEFEVLDAR